jgi:hypothetical protein
MSPEPGKMPYDMDPSLSRQSVVVASKNHVSCELHGETALLHLKTGVYYGLNPVGARIWSLIQQPRRVEEIRDALSQEYQVEAEPCEQDVIALLEKLLAEGLVELKEGPPAI